MEGNSKILRKDGKNMSFVGIHNTNEGLIAFADSKVTLKYENGFMMEDKKRGLINKVFKNNQFIFVTYGNNELFSEKYKTNIEDYIQEHLIDDMGYLEFFEEMNEKIQENPANYHDGEYHFIIGSKDQNNHYYIVRCQIKQGSQINYYDKTYDKKIYTGGDEFYTHLYEGQVFLNDADIHKYSQMIQNFIEDIIKAKDGLSNFYDYHYNSAGLPVNIKIFQ